jgi:hypothetical protein
MISPFKHSSRMSVEGLAVALSPWAAGRYVERLRTQFCEPVAYDLGRRLLAVVGSNAFRRP